MVDYGHDLLFGTFLQPSPDAAQQLALLTEQVGLDLVSVSDHPYWPHMLDAWTTMSYIAARTERVRVVANVANLPLRPPTQLAVAAASLDALSGGRFELGLGAGALWDAIAARGGPRHSPGESVAAVEEAVQVIRALWTPGDAVRFEGRHYRLDGVEPGPFPVHDSGIWIGAYQPRMLRLTGRLADGWLPSSPFLPPEQLQGANLLIDEAAIAAGRSPLAVRRLYNIAGEFKANGTDFLQGPPKVWVDQLTELTLTQGISGYILYLVESADHIRRFAAEVAPAVRENVAAERARHA
jgi:alkanesulfonate monooxygenase SsuD/methylene tetrahydromethanopterin reductase-like flavin-dependent oxidoreductase (luciferase family)